MPLKSRTLLLPKTGWTLSLINLAQLLQIRDYDSFDIVDQGYDILGTEILEKTPQQLVAAAQAYRKEVLIAETNVALAQKDLQIARSAYLPSIGAFFNYNTRESDRFSGITTLVDSDNPVVSTADPIGFVDGSGAAVYGFAPNIIGYQEVAAKAVSRTALFE